MRLLLYISIYVTEVDPACYDTAVIGNFVEADARAFLQQLLPTLPPISDEDWNVIYEVSR